MKPTLLIAILSLAATTLSAAAGVPDRSYYVTELAPQQKFDVYNDGQNTYLESIPGLVVTGATADGERYIVNGVPSQIRGFMNGKPITVVRGTPPVAKPATPDPAVVSAQIKQLTEKLESLSSKVQPKVEVPKVGETASAAAGENASPSPDRRMQSMQAMLQIAQERNGLATQLPAAAGGTKKAGAPSITDVYTYSVTPKDENLRLLVERWAKMVGWDAVWDVERDILIGNAGQKAADFKGAVRWVLSSTELSDVVVKPCFYSNSVVRVVRKTVKCNPNE